MSKLNPISEERKREIKGNIIKEIKALIFPTIILAIIAGFFVFVINYQSKEEPEEIIEVRAYAGEGQPAVLENDLIKFEMDTKTTNFTVTKKSTGKVWKSVPDGAADDTIAVTEEKNKLQANVVLTYADETGLTVPLDAFSFSSQNGIYEVDATEDYVRVDYSIGKVAKEFIIPPIMEADRFLELTGELSINDSENVKQFYKKVDINNLKKNDNKEELLANYPILETSICYILRSGLKDNAKKSIQQCLEKVGYTYEEYLENKALDQSETTNSNPVFNCSVIYKLDGEDLVVEVPFDSLESKTKYPIYSLNILPYFGAGGKEDTGYLVVPEGGGSVINFNNGKTSQSNYYSNVYGWDMGISRKDLVHSTISSMNLYGIANGNDSFICILEDGSSYASIKADVSGKTNSYNYVNAEYTIKPNERYDLGQQANTDMYVYLESLPLDESIVKRYRFVDSADYVDMAKAYRDYLIEKYPESFTKNTDSSTPVAVEVVGAVDKVKQIVGVPVSRPLPLTTYKEAADLMNDLKSKGIDNLSFKYTGWCNGGVKQQVLNKVKTIHSLGSKSDLNNLISEANNLNVDFYLDGITDYANNSNLFDGFFSYRDAAKFLSRKRAELHIYSAITYARRDGTDPFFLLHGDEIIKMANNFVNETSKLNANVSFQNIGQDLSSDFYRKDYTSRDEQMDMQVEVLANTKKSGQKIMINEGNAYAVPYADFITNMDLRGSEYTILDGCIPFYQIALHGYVNYSGFPINTSGNEDLAVLYAAEYGAGLSFSLMKESPFTLQKTLYTEYYASDYDSWQGTLYDIYSRYNAELGHTFNQTITDHKILSDTLSVTTYEDGTKVYVNYSYGDASENGITIPARDYVVVR